MARVEFDMKTPLSPEKITSMLTDFSEKRPEIWPGLWADAYEVYSVGPTSAEVREGSKSPKVWARERYDWSVPGTIRWEVLESNFCKPGSFVEARITPHDEGSSIHITWDRTPTSFMGYVAAALIPLTKGAPVKASMNAAFKRALK